MRAEEAAGFLSSEGAGHDWGPGRLFQRNSIHNKLSVVSWGAVYICPDPMGIQLLLERDAFVRQMGECYTLCAVARSPLIPASVILSIQRRRPVIAHFLNYH